MPRAAFFPDQYGNCSWKVAALVNGPDGPVAVMIQATEGETGMRRANLGHRLTKMVARDPNEAHRSATSLELLYDLAFVVAFAPAGEQLAHLLADGYVSEGIAGFAFAMFATCWAWINFSWLASSFDTNDWLYRVMTMVQMVVVVVMGLGLPAMFRSLPTGGHLDIRIMAAGYVVLRFAMVAQWLRAIARSPARRKTSLAHGPPLQNDAR
jgi:low temperature requirement protein LtrA